MTFSRFATDMNAWRSAGMEGNPPRGASYGLVGANLSRADLREARVTSKQLAQAASLKGAIMPDGTRHE